MQEGSADPGRDPATPRQVGDDDDYSDGDDLYIMVKCVCVCVSVTKK